MNSLKAFCLLALLVAAASASPKHKNQQNNNNDNTGNSGSNSLKPSEWITPSELQSAPSVEDVTLQQLENMSVEEGQKLVEKIYHLAQINHKVQPSFVPSPSNIPATVYKNNGEPVPTTLSQLPETVKQQSNYGNQEVTIFITGLPQNNAAATKAHQKLVEAYLQRYNGQQQPMGNTDFDYDAQNQGQGQGNQGQGNQRQGNQGSSEEDYSQSWKNANNDNGNNGNLIVIKLGNAISSFKRLVMLDVQQTGNMIGNVLAQLSNQADISPDTIHIVASGIAAQVAGPAARQYNRQTGQQIRRITALDPAKIFAKNPKQLTGLARGDAQFVDAIHTSTCGIGTRQRVGDIDFYVNGPASTVPGAKNVIEASMRAVRYYAETVRPGNERNFPANAANSLQQYRNGNTNGDRAYMGIATEYDEEGDFVVEVNANSPFGKKTTGQKQRGNQGNHQQQQQNWHMRGANSGNSGNNNNNDYN